MSWNRLPSNVREAAERACTDRERIALRLWVGGAGYGRVAELLGLSKSTVRDRIKSATRKINRELHGDVPISEEELLHGTDSTDRGELLR